MTSVLSSHKPELASLQSATGTAGGTALITAVSVNIRKEETSFYFPTTTHQTLNSDVPEPSNMQLKMLVILLK